MSNISITSTLIRTSNEVLKAQDFNELKFQVYTVADLIGVVQLTCQIPDLLFRERR